MHSPGVRIGRGRAAEFVIAYSSTLIGICHQLPGCDQSLEAVKHGAVQAITGMNRGGQDRRFGNPLVAGSSPARPTQNMYYLGRCLTFCRRVMADSVSVDPLQRFRLILDTASMRELSLAEQRYQAVSAVISDGLSISQVAENVGVSRQTLHSWLARYEAGGLEGLVNRSHRPASCPHQMPAVVEAVKAHAWTQSRPV
jgi:leucine-zipper of insertion element IS481